jgi:hypothetical protein
VPDDLLPTTEAPPTTNWLYWVCSYASHAAAYIYHDMVAAESQVVKWRHNNPQLAGVFDMGVNYLTTLAASHGVPVGALQPAALEIEIALKTLAMKDPTFNTGPAKTV